MKFKEYLKNYRESCKETEEKCKKLYDLKTERERKIESIIIGIYLVSTVIALILVFIIGVWSFPWFMFMIVVPLIPLYVWEFRLGNRLKQRYEQTYNSKF